MAKAKTRNRGLGRGLDALFADQRPIAGEQDDASYEIRDEDDGAEAVRYISINDIKPNHVQPRRDFNEEGIAELADSILEHGIIQPLIVRRAETGYELVAGERRWRAARKAGLREIPCLIRELNEEENMLVAIIENMQREDLNPIEEAEGLSEMIRRYGLTQEEVSKSVSKSRPYITNALRLLNLPEAIRDAVAAGRISAGHARALLPVENETRRMEIFERIEKEDLSVRQTERLVREQGTKPRKTARRRVKSRDVLAVEQDLKDLFGTKVSIDAKGRGGTLSFEYYSTEELNRLIDILKTVSLS